MLTSTQRFINYFDCNVPISLAASDLNRLFVCNGKRAFLSKTHSFPSFVYYMHNILCVILEESQI